MEAQKKQEDETPTPEVVKALLDFARLSYYVEFAASETSMIHRGATEIAAILLDRLLVLCQAQRGAILLTLQHPTEAKRAVMLLPPNRKAIHISALRDMNEEEAYALVTSCSEDAAIQSPPEKPCWLICRLPMALAQWEGQASGDHHTNIGEQLSAEASSHRTFFPLYALLVLGWDGNNKQARLEALKKAHVVLPFVTDAAGAVLTNILLAERVYELDAHTDHKALHEMELLKAELLATVSHELRSPLASVKGYTATLLRHERRIAREERHEFLLAIKEASDRLEAVIDRLLEISQLETGGISIERSSVDLVYLIREAIASMERRLEVPEREEGLSDRQKHLTFTLHIQDDKGMPSLEVPIIQADRHRLREVLDHLLENALKYSPEGGTIEVVLGPLAASSQARLSAKAAGKSTHDKKMSLHPSVPRSQHMVEICVHDHGMGIPETHLERIFDRFHRVDTRLTREVGGMGLGLAICKQIVELHGGMIWAESEIGTGSTFHVWLPTDQRA